MEQMNTRRTVLSQILDIVWYLVVAAGTVDLHHGSGALSKRVSVDTRRLQGATLYSPAGAVIGRQAIANNFASLSKA